MSLDEWNAIVEIAKNVAQILALGAAGIWAYLRYFRERDAYPKVRLEVDIEFLGQQQGRWLVLLIARVSNTGKVRHWIKDLEFYLRGLPGDEPLNEGGDEILRQVVFSNKLKEGRWLRQVKAPVGNVQGRPWLMSKSIQLVRWSFSALGVSREPADGETFVDPGVENTYQHVAMVPAGMAFLLLKGSFRYHNDQESDYHAHLCVSPVPGDFSKVAVAPTVRLRESSGVGMKSRE